MKAATTVLRIVPYNSLLRIKDFVEKTLFDKPWPEDVPSVFVNCTATELDKVLRRRKHYEGLRLSYHYKGQILDLRKPIGMKDYGAAELHIRGRKVGNRLELITHVEPSRYEEQEKHIEADHVDYEEGNRILKKDLSDLYIKYYGV